MNSMTRRIPGRLCAAILLALLLGVFRMEASLASPASIADPIHILALDSDSDGIPDDMDPDDDNDGVPDSDQGGEGTSSGNEPLPDSDDDGITNDMDPDDNNNAVADEDETVPTPSDGNSTDPGGSSPSHAPSPGEQPLVSSLPVTGSGHPDASHGPHFAVIVAISAVLLASVAAHRLTLDNRREAR
jgi:hypothetical protein